jgi:hypothetical protein
MSDTVLVVPRRDVPGSRKTMALSGSGERLLREALRVARGRGSEAVHPEHVLIALLETEWTAVGAVLFEEDPSRRRLLLSSIGGLLEVRWEEYSSSPVGLGWIGQFGGEGVSEYLSASLMDAVSENFDWAGTIDSCLLVAASSRVLAPWSMAVLNSCGLTPEVFETVWRRIRGARAVGAD